MPLTYINTREDLDNILGTPQHDAAMNLLGGTIWRLEKDDVAKVWKAILDESTISKFGLTIADFINISSPELPTYIAEITPIKSLTAWQVRKVLTQLGLRDSVETAVANADQATKDAWTYASSFQRDDAILNAMALTLNLTPTQLNDMFNLGVTL